MSLINALLSLLLLTDISAGNVSQPAVTPETAPPTGQFIMKELKPDYTPDEDPWMETGLDGRHVKKAEVQFNATTYDPYVFVEFNYAGTQLLTEITTRNIGKQVAIFIGDELITAPTVREAITGGAVQITGRFTLEQANNLTNTINSGISPD